MTEQELRIKYVNCAKSFFGVEQGSERHRQIVDAYNSYLPHPRGYKLKYIDAWCAGFTSAIAILCDLTAVVPVECSCSELVKIFKRNGRWKENDAYRPMIGDLLFYDWQDGKDYANTDNTGAPDHVGIVVWANGTDFLVIEGNKGSGVSSVGYREMNINGRYIRGFGVPDYASIATPSEGTGKPVTGTVPRAEICTPELAILRYGAKGEAVRALQTLLNLRGGYALSTDASFGPKTKAAVNDFQRNSKLTVDGCVGPQTWGKLVEG